MDRIELAERRYQALIGAELVSVGRPERYWQMPLEDLRAWIADYVLPAVDEVLPRPLFRDHATWPLRVFTDGGETPERAAVQQVDARLVAAATALRKLARTKAITLRLQQLHAAASPSGTAVAEEPAYWRTEEVEITDSTPRCRPSLPPNLHVMIPYYLAQLDGMSKRSWTDLVSLDDYFEPVAGMLLADPMPGRLQDGTFIVSLTPHLYHVGDSITRCMVHRIRSWLSLLQEARSTCYDAVRDMRRAPVKAVEAEQSAFQELHRSLHDLQGLCVAGSEARMHDACIAMTQVYAEFHPNPDLSWLEVPDWLVQRWKGRLTHAIFSSRDLETLERIAGALGELRLLYRELSPADSAVDLAVATGGLVLVEKPRKAFWEGQPINHDWLDRKYKNHWEMLWKLAINAKSASAVGNFDLYNDGVANSTLHSRAMRLKQLLPPSLRQHIKPGTERATHRLTLPMNLIHLFPSRSS